MLWESRTGQRLHRPVREVSGLRRRRRPGRARRHVRTLHELRSPGCGGFEQAF